MTTIDGTVIIPVPIDCPFSDYTHSYVNTTDTTSEMIIEKQRPGIFVPIVVPSNTEIYIYITAVYCPRRCTRFEMLYMYIRILLMGRGRPVITLKWEKPPERQRGTSAER